MKKFLTTLLFLIPLLSFSQDTIYDCAGTDVSAVSNWIGDGYCDDGAYSYGGSPVYFNCEEFNFDGGDCPDPNAEILGCTDPSAFNYNPGANVDDGLCIEVVEGCTDEIALNYDSLANINNALCEFPIFGCTDSDSPNYNPLAESDNGSCVNQSCSDGESKMVLQVTLDQYPSETGWILTDISTGQPVEIVIAGEYTYNQANSTIPYELCVPTSGVELILSDTYGDGMAGSLYNGGTDGNFIILADTDPCGGGLDVVWSLDSANFGSVVYSGVINLPYCEVPVISGCMDYNFVEYNFNATFNVINDCITPKVYGCIDNTQFNYTPEANTMDILPICQYTLAIFDDAADGWGDSYIVVTQGDSILGTYTMGPDNYNQNFSLLLNSNKSVEVRYFEVKQPQQPQEEVEFQTLHNSFKIFSYSEDNDILLEGGTNPFDNNGAGALQSFQAPFWDVYSAIPYCGNYCDPIVYGCTFFVNLAQPDILMFNYNPLANVNQVSDEDTSNPCIVTTYGCTDNDAYGYNSNANIDDGSCLPWFVGCMDEEAWNYQYLANIWDEESCVYFGCIDELALNYDSTANTNNGSCIYPTLGCTNPDAFNFEVDANVNDGSCIAELYGCMDPTMWNYNELANMPSDNCIPYMFGCVDETSFNFDPIANTDNESCIPFIFGCTDPAAFNFDVEANTENFLCIETIYGCLDETAFNYSMLANTDNGACIATLIGCTDNSAENYEVSANTDDGSCLYDGGCIGEPGTPYWLNDPCYAWVIDIDVLCCDNEWDNYCQSQYNYCDVQYHLTLDDLRDSEVLIYPNPTTGVLNILAKNDIKIDVTNLLGETITTIENKSRIDLSRFSNGMYILNITYNDLTIQHKVIKQ